MLKNIWMGTLLLTAGAVLANETEVVTMAPMDISATPISKYSVAEVNTATFSSMPPEELPQVVDVLTEDFINETASLDLHDLLRYQPGIYTGGKTLQSRTAGQYSIRGMSGSEAMIDGTLALPGFMGTFLDPNALERVEIVKGPVGSTTGGTTSSLGPYGAGGSINLILKKANLENSFNRSAVSAQLGNDLQRYRLSFDVNSAGEGVALRIPGNLEYGKPFWLPSGYDWRESIFIAPSVAFQLSETWQMGIDTTLQHTDQPGYQGIPIYQGQPQGGYDWDSYIAGTDLRDEYTGYTAQAWIEGKASEQITLRTGAGVAGSSIESEHLGSSAYASKSTTLPYSYSYYDRENLNWNVYQRMLVELEGDKLNQDIVAQVDYGQKQEDGTGSFGDVASDSTFNGKFRDSETDTEVSKLGAFAQDTLSYGMWRLLGGMRWDQHESNLGNNGEGWSPRIGASVLPSNNTVIFGNISRTEAPNFGYMKSKNEELTSSWNAVQYETGLRYAPVAPLWITLSLYLIEQDNTPAYDDATGYYYEEDGTESRGVEVSANGDIMENWSLYAAYAYNEYEAEGQTKEFDRYPPHAVTLSTSYRINSGPLDDVVLGLAYRFRAKYDATFRGDYVGEDYYIAESHVFDCSAATSLKKFGGPENWEISLAIKNIFDEQYIESNRHYYQCFPGDPRLAEIALKGSF